MATEVVAKRVSLDHVLYATDFSRYSQNALPFVLSIARKYGSTISAVHVIPSMIPGSFTPTMELQAMAAQALREANESMKDLQSRMRGVPHETIIRKGDILAELSALVEEKKIDLIVLGTHGRAGASRLLMGSVAEHIFRRASCPVLTVGPDVSEEPDSIADIHTILYPTDFSFESLVALPQALSLVQEHQARLYLLHVTPNPLLDSDEIALKALLRALVPLEANLWCEPKVYVEYGDPAEKILNLAEELAIDVIALGIKHVSRFAGARAHLGMATAYKIVSHAICPVLTLRG